MSFDPDDPRLTALVLGELDDHERAAFEAELDQDPDAARELEDIAALAALLSDELGAEGGDGLATDQHAAIERAMRAEPAATLDASDAPANDDRTHADNVIPLWERSSTRALAAVAALALVVLGAVALPLGMQHDAPPQHASVSSEESDDRVVQESEPELPDRFTTIIHDPSTPTSETPPAQEHEQARDNGVVSALDPKPTEAAVVDTPIAARTDPSVAVGSTPRNPLPKMPVTGEIDDASRKRLEGLGYLDTAPPLRDKAGKSSEWLHEKKKRLSALKAKNTVRDQLEDLGYVGGSTTPSAPGGLFDRVDESGDVDSNGLPSSGPRPAGVNGERYENAEATPFKSVTSHPLSTFSIDVDTASYANVRRYLNGGQLPPAGAVRVEEMINYFDYGYAPPRSAHPFAAHVEVGRSPWNAQRRLVRVGIKAREIAQDQRPASNLVFLIDVSGSMSSANKLPLLVDAMKLLVAQLDQRDRVSIVVYAGSEGVALPTTRGDQRGAILRALNRLRSGGSTNGAAGITRAYQLATKSFIEGGVNRVILATDGDFNVGLTSRDALTQLIQHKAKSGVYLSVLGFGMGNYNDATLETLADKGNGNYAYIDTLNEARKVLVHDLTGTLVTVAKDVKIQVEFNPNRVASYRLVGYTNRLLAARDFNDDTKDAGEIGAGHTVTALYEVTPVEHLHPGVDPLKYQRKTDLTPEGDSLELLNVKLRYKPPTSDTSTLVEFPVQDADRALEETSADMRFAASVAMFGQLLRRDPSAKTTRYADVLRLARAAERDDRYGYRAEFMRLVQRAAALDPSRR